MSVPKSLQRDLLMKPILQYEVSGIAVHDSEYAAEAERISALSDSDFFKECGGVEAALRFCTQVNWGHNESVKPLVAQWAKAHMDIYTAEMTRRAAKYAGRFQLSQLTNPGEVEG